MVRNIDDGGKYRFAGGAPLLVRCDLAELPEPAAGRQRHVRRPRLAPGRAEACASTRSTARPSCNTDTSAYLPLRGRGARSRSRAATAAPRWWSTTARSELLGTGTPAMPHMVPQAAGRLLPHHRRERCTASRAARPSSSTDCTPLGGCQGAVPVDATAIASSAAAAAGHAKDGTVLRGLPSKRTWEIVGGKRRETFIARLDAVEVDDGAIGLIPADGPAPAPPAPEVFKPVISSGYKVFRPLHAVHVAEGARRAARLGRHRLLRRQAEGLPVQEGQAVPPEGHVPERLQPLVQEGEAQATRAR